MHSSFYNEDMVVGLVFRVSWLIWENVGVWTVKEKENTVFFFDVFASSITGLYLQV